MRPLPRQNSCPYQALRHGTAAVVLLGALAAGCSAAPTPEQAESCEELAAVGIDWVRQTADALEGQSIEVVTGDVEPPKDLSELQMIGAAIDVRAEELGCPTAALNQAIATGVADLESDDPVVSLFLRIVQSTAPSSSE